MDQKALNTLANNLEVIYNVNDNISAGSYIYSASIFLTNYCKIPLPTKSWTIYFCHDRMIQPVFLPRPEGYIFKDIKIKITHINGCLFKIEPIDGFRALRHNDTLEINFHAKGYSVARTDLYPNWYIVFEDLEPELITNTVGEELTFVNPFEEPIQWKRFDYELPSGRVKYDLYDPFTPEVRFEKNKTQDVGKSHQYIIPSPKSVYVKEGKIMDLKNERWAITTDKKFMPEAKYLSEQIGIFILEDVDPQAASKLYTHTIKLVKEQKYHSEGYHINVESRYRSITIEAKTPAGIFYGIQTFLSVVKENYVPEVHIYDEPRYIYRGMHIDVARNFISKEVIMKLLDAMSMYKLNKLHLHLTDDEGWRLEIPGLPELTEIGSKRGHDMEEKTCLLPLLGSGPTPCSPASGYYSVQDYKDILTYAHSRHIDVIPEIDVPGHSHAAVRAMEARYDRLLSDSKEKAEEYLLTDLESSEENVSNLMFMANSLNPGLESTFRFIDKIIEELKKMHKGINDLKIFHFGGDEVPFEAWENSPACQALIKSKTVSSFNDLMQYFVSKVAKLAHKHGLSIAAWQDAMINGKNNLIIPRTEFKNDSVIVYAWKNVWETGMASDAYKLANEGYKVVMSQATHLYFDHPYEPDPEERGLYWAARYIDTQKTFCFRPDHLYANADVKLTGEPIEKDDVCMLSKVKLEKPDNIIGMQGQLWTELVRTDDQFYYMVFPRLLALAERAWHKAEWEDISKTGLNVEESRLENWNHFASALGYRELLKLDEMGIAYRIPLPGARVCSKTKHVEANCIFPGLPIEYSVNDGQTWEIYKHPFKVPAVEDYVLLRTCSADGKRFSRQIKLSLKSS